MFLIAGRTNYMYFARVVMWGLILITRFVAIQGCYQGLIEKHASSAIKLLNLRVEVKIEI